MNIRWRKCLRCNIPLLSPPPRLQRYSTPSADTLPSVPPPSARTLLPSRSFLALHGTDAPKFLQGLVTANITSTVPSQPQVLYATFLNARGRLLNDVFIYPLSVASPLLTAAEAGVPANSPADSPVFIIEVDAGEAKSLAARLNKHKLRAKVGIRVLPEGALEAHAAWSEPDPQDGDAGTAAIDLVPVFERPYSSPFHIARDHRTSTLGVRALRAGSPSATPPPTPVFDLPATDPRHYDIRRYVRGVAEGPAELARETMLPHTANLELLGAIDLRKGCYIGQELVTRTQHRSVVRRRIVGCKLWGPGTQLPPSELVYEGAESSVIKHDHADWSVPPGAEVQWGQDESDTQQANDGQSADAPRAPRKRGTRSQGRWITGIGDVGLAEMAVEPVLGIPPTGELPPREEARREIANSWRLRWQRSDERATPMVAAFIPEYWRERQELLARHEASPAT